jgi:hypothetical protein
MYSGHRFLWIATGSSRPQPAGRKIHKILHTLDFEGLLSAAKRSISCLTLTVRSVSIPAIPEGPLSGIQFFEQKLNFRCSEADRHEVLFTRHCGYRPMWL